MSLFCALFMCQSVCPFLGAFGLLFLFLSSFDDAAVEAGAVYDEAHQRRVYLSAPAKEYIDEIRSSIKRNLHQVHMSL